MSGALRRQITRPSFVSHRVAASNHLRSERRRDGSVWDLQGETDLLAVPFSDTIDPGMGTTHILSSTLFGRTRGAVLALLYGHVGESFYLRQLARRTEIALGPVQREIRQLVDAGLVKRETQGKQIRFSANRGSPVFDEIKSLVAKTVGMHDVLAATLSPLRRKIDLAFVYGSVARSSETERSDVDLMIVGTVDFGTVVERLADAQQTLNREINPTVYSVREFVSKVRGNFLKTVLVEKKLFLIGDENVLRELGQK
jgi:predicted nucleotidyltransferase